MFRIDIGSERFSVGTFELHAHVVWVPPHAYGGNESTGNNESRVAGANPACSITPLGKGIADEVVLSQHDGIAHVRVAVVHHRRYRFGIGRN